MKTKICPKCKSTDISLNIQTSAAYGAPQMWRCNNCGFESYAFPEIEKKIKKINKKLKKK